MDEVRLIPWPSGATDRDTAACAGVPRLLLVDADAAPPVLWERIEDWVRLPADPEDVERRVAHLARRHREGASAAIGRRALRARS